MKEDHVTTEIVNRPIDNSYAQVRTTLGISPSDSLQFAPIAVIVEGATDVIGLTILLEKLHKWNTPGFEDVMLALPLCCFVDAGGDGYAKMVRFCIAQGSQVVVFLDGDKNVLQSIKDEFECRNVALVQPDNKQEIEQLIDHTIYFDALHQLLSEDEVKPTGDIDLSEFEKWLKSQPVKFQNMTFSRQVGRWLDDIAPGFKFIKPRVFKRAVNLVSTPDHVQDTVLRDLISEILIRLPSRE
jgi:bifunctional DNA-binding transcriptional regulator/antitoxin component of YhaV-PrlF toxin-antitoxin module